MAHKTDKTARPPRPLLGEIVTSGPRSGFGGFVSEIRRPSDRILAGFGGDLSRYESLLRDGQVKSTFQQLRLAVVSKAFEVKPGGESALDIAAADFLTEQLAHLRWDDITDKMLHGLFYGYAVAECLWALAGGKVVLDAVKVRRAKRFAFGKDGTLRLLKRGEPNGQIMPERKFWVYSAGADNDDDPYGLGLGHWLYWPVFLKRNGVKFWAIALEKFGAPTAIGTYPTGASQDDIRKLLDAAIAVSTDAAVAIPEGMAVTLLEAQRRSGGDHAVFAGYLDADISKIVLSQTMTTDSGSSLSQSEVHERVRDDIAEAASKVVCDSFNAGPARWLTEWNFPGARVPHVKRIFEEADDLTEAANRDKIIHDMGFTPTLDYVKAKYGGDWVEAGAPAAPGGQGGFADFMPSGATPAHAPTRPPTGSSSMGGRVGAWAGHGTHQTLDHCPGCGSPVYAERAPIDDSIDQLVAEFSDGDWERVMGPSVDAIQALLDEAKTADEVMARLPEAIPGMDIADFGERLARAMFATRVAGKLGIVPETGKKSG